VARTNRPDALRRVVKLLRLCGSRFASDARGGLSERAAAQSPSIEGVKMPSTSTDFMGALPLEIDTARMKREAQFAREFYEKAGGAEELRRAGLLPETPGHPTPSAHILARMPVGFIKAQEDISRRAEAIARMMRPAPFAPPPETHLISSHTAARLRAGASANL
jgi:hypothetical protein